MIFESHAHYDDPRFDEDRDQLLSQLVSQGITKVINVAANMESSLKSIELARKYDFIYASVGVHPHDVKFMVEDDLETLIGLAAYEKVVAIGEIGLDYYYDNSPREIQRLWFREQLILANQLGLPVIIHSRDAAQETFDILMEEKAHEVGGVIHCFSGSKEMAMKYVELGYSIGIGGVITYSNAKNLVEVVKAIPLESILIETDCPYLSPIPMRGKRNDSTNLQYIVDTIANHRGISSEEVMEKTYDNAVKLFL